MSAIFLTHACFNALLHTTIGLAGIELTGIANLTGSGNVSLELLPWQPLLATMNLWYAVPLLISVSLVCAATRQEEMIAILQHALRFGVWVVVFMAIVMVALTLLGWLT